jgi:putative ABC transport system permease protein
MNFLWWRRKQLDRELEEEVRTHLEMAANERVDRGEDKNEAERSARREFGNVGLVKEVTQDVWGWRWLENLYEDARFGLRMLRKSPGFSAVAVLTLALGIGANTAVFTVVNGVLLQPMPFPEPGRLFLVSFSPLHGPFETGPSLSDRDYLEFRDQDRLFEHLTSFTGGRVNLAGTGDPAQIPAASVTIDFFSTLQLRPEIGRGFSVEEDQPGRDNVVVLSNKLWNERFGSDPQILGKTVSLDSVSRTVVGVMPAGFGFPYEAEVWLPLAIRIDSHNSYSRPVVGRLKAGFSRQQALAELETFTQRLPRRPGENKQELVAQIIPLKELLVTNIRQSLLIFAGAVGFVLLIACANVANLFLARAAGRGQEMAVRNALGAGRWRLARQLLTESTLISVAGGAVGIVLAFWSVPALIALAPAGTIPRIEMIRIDASVLVFTFGLSMITGMVFGLAPTLQATRRDVRESLNRAGRSLTGRHEGMRNALAVSEIALALVLLTGAGLMLKSFLRLRAVKPGFEPENVMTMTVDLPESAYRTAAQMRAFHTRTLESLSNLPGVLAAGAVNWRPLGNELTMGDFQVEGGQPLPPGYMVDKPCVSPGYFRAMGIRLLRGREFAEGDDSTAPGVVIVSQSVARSLWPGSDPLGKRVSMEDHPKPGDWLTIVGVVDDVKQQGLAKKSDPAIYQPYLQVTHPFFLIHMTFVARTASNPLGVASGMRGVLSEIDKDQPVQSITAMDNLIAETTAEPRFQARLLTVFAIMALALAIVGIYGVLAYSVAQRTHEIGVRMALGAQTANVVRMLLRSTLVLVGAGVMIGTAGALAVTRVLAKFLFEVKPSDPPTIAAVALTLVCAALAACYIPARRAMRVDPMVALRYE